MYGVVVIALFYFSARVPGFPYSPTRARWWRQKWRQLSNLWPLRRIWRKQAATVAHAFFPGSPPGPTHTPPFPSLSNCPSHGLPTTNENPYSCCFAQYIIPPYLECQLLHLSFFFFFLLKEVVLTRGKPRSFVVKWNWFKSPIYHLYLTSDKLLNLMENQFLCL